MVGNCVEAEAWEGGAFCPRASPYHSPASKPLTVLAPQGELTRRLSSPSMRSKSSASVSDPEGLCFEEIRFSPSGKYLATLAAPKPAPSHKHVTVYEIQDQRESLVPVRNMVDRDVGSPFGFSWIENSTLLIFCRASSGREGSCVQVRCSTHYPLPAGKRLSPLASSSQRIRLRLVCSFPCTRRWLLVASLEQPPGLPLEFRLLVGLWLRRQPLRDSSPWFLTRATNGAVCKLWPVLP